MSKWRTASGVAAALLLASAAHGQPSSAAWQPMRELVFDSTVFTSTGSTADREVMQAMWAQELSKPRGTGVGGRKLPAFTLLGDVTPSGRQRIVFSMFAAAGDSRCEDAANGASANDIYNVCVMRVMSWPPSAGETSTELPGYCMMFGDNDRRRNRTEYRVDAGQPLTVHFRTMQYGKTVPACNRSLRLE